MTATRTWRWRIAVGAVGCLAGLLTIWAPLITGALLAAAGLFALTLRRPAAGIAIWLLAVVLVPDWTRLAVGLRLSHAVALPVLAGLIAHRCGDFKNRLRLPDALLVIALLIAAWQTSVEGSPPAFLVVVCVMAGGYLFGRWALPETQTLFAVLAVVIALWGIVEFATGWHAFTSWQLRSDHHWNEIQPRGGSERAEATMGHAIAFGATCAMGIPFARTLRRYAVPAQFILALGVLTSLSRGPMLALVVTLGVGALLATSGKRRGVTLIMLAVAGVAVYVVFQGIYSASDSGETTMSGEQRSLQFQRTIDLLRPLAPGTTFELGDESRYVSDAADVIDSTPLRLALNFGWITAGLLLAPLFAVAMRASRGRAGPAVVALLGQVPVLLVTTLITQWQVLVFFVAGMAVSEIYGAGRPQRVSGGNDDAIRMSQIADGEEAVSSDGTVRRRRRDVSSTTRPGEVQTPRRQNASDGS